MPQRSVRRKTRKKGNGTKKIINFLYYDLKIMIVSMHYEQFEKFFKLISCLAPRFLSYGNIIKVSFGVIRL